MEISAVNNDLILENNMEKDDVQRSFLETTLGKIVNTGIDIGIRAALPDFIDEQVINIKDNLFNYGLREGIAKTIEDAIDIGKTAVGIFTGNFENINQMKTAIQSGGLIDGISDILDIVLDKVNEKGVISYNVTNTIKSGKNLILSTIEDNIENKFKEQSVDIKNIETYMNDWRKAFENKNFDAMDVEYNKIEKLLNKLVPLEKIIDQAKIIENLHNLIKNNGYDFNLNKEQLELAEKLI